MAQLELSADEAKTLATIVKCWYSHLSENLADENDQAVALDICDRHLKKISALSFNIRACIVCGTEFEATNPRKQTCSDACRQALSRSKRDRPPRTPMEAMAAHVKAAAATPDCHDETVTAKEEPEPALVANRVGLNRDQSFVDDWGTLPPSARKRQWFSIRVFLKADDKKGSDGPERSYGPYSYWGTEPRTLAFIQKDSQEIGRSYDSASEQYSYWFMINAKTGEVFSADFEVPQLAIDWGREFVFSLEAFPAPDRHA